MPEYPTYINVIGGIAGTFTTIAFFPQVIKVVKTRSTKDLSLVMFIIFCIGVFLWIIFGILLGSVPIILANLITWICSIIILCYKIKYR